MNRLMHRVFYGKRVKATLIIVIVVCITYWLSYLRFPSKILVITNDTLSTSKQTGTQRTKPRKVEVFNPSIPMQYQSLYWKPIIVTDCQIGASDSAPCIQQKTNGSGHSNLISSQQLIFPQIKARLPIFVSDDDQKVWIEKVHTASDLDRMGIEKGWVIFLHFQGQNIVFQNATFNSFDYPIDSWSNTGCMGSHVSHAPFLNSKPTQDTNDTNSKTVDTLVMAVSPDSWSFQHFMDRVAVTISQASLIWEDSDSISVVSGKHPKFSFADEYYKALGVEKHFHSGDYPNQIKAKKLIFSCRAPLVHPHSTKLVSEKLGLYKNGLIPLKDRRVVYYLSRTGSESNGGRKVANESRFLEKLELYLQKRGKNERLEVLQPDNFQTLDDLVSKISQNALAMIGPHGGMFYNARFALPETLIVEFVPKDRFTVMFYEQAVNLHQKYAVILTNQLTNLEIDFKDLTRILDSELGKPLAHDTIEKIDHWHIQ